MQVQHEKFGFGQIINSTEVLDEAGNIVSADVMFDHGIEMGVALGEAAKNAYAIGMAAAEKSTGDTPPLKKSTIVKGHEIAKGIMKKEDAEEIEEKLIGDQKKIDKNKNGKLDAQDFKMLRKEETEQPPARVTPATAQLRMPALENSIREIMNQNVDLRKMAKEAEFKNRAK